MTTNQCFLKLLKHLTIIIIKNVVVERHMLLKYNRQEGQSLINFVTKLKLLSAICEYGQLENSIIRNGPKHQWTHIYYLQLLNEQ